MARISKERQQEIRSSILENARKMISEQGYEKTSTKDIAKAVGIAEGTLFNYFDSKSDVMIEAFVEGFRVNDDKEVMDAASVDIDGMADSILCDYIEKMYRPMFKIPKGLLLELFSAFITIGKKKKSRLEYLISLDFKYLEKTEEMVGRLKEAGLFIEETDPKLMAELIYGVLFYEVGMYLYNKDTTMADVNADVRAKVRYLCKGYNSNQS